MQQTPFTLLARLGLATVPAALIASSCVTLYDLESYASAVTLLCERVAACEGGDSFYPGCVEQAGARLGAASAEERAAFLLVFTDSGCLESCDAARSCFDTVPLCGDSRSSCGVEAQCCGFWTAGAACQGGACCQPNGVSCTSDDDCCASSCIAGANGNTCGGGTCAPLDASCNVATPCCSASHVCSPESATCVPCAQNGASCDASAVCCSRYCERGAGDDGPGVCADAPCGKQVGVDCTSPEECCGGFCVAVPPGDAAVCSDGDCVPEGFGCVRAADCCDQAFCVGGLCTKSPGCSKGLHERCLPGECCEGTCNAALEECCVLDSLPCSGTFECCGDATCVAGDDGTATCESVVPCLAQGAPCVLGDVCCSKRCSPEKSTCCLATADDCSHTVCKAGAPLQPLCSELAAPVDPDDDDATSRPFGGPGCITSICNTEGLGHCCCDGWDDACVAAALASNVCDVKCSDG